jgi:hypothetical protein
MMAALKTTAIDAHAHRIGRAAQLFCCFRQREPRASPSLVLDQHLRHARLDECFEVGMRGKMRHELVQKPIGPSDAHAAARPMATWRPEQAGVGSLLRTVCVVSKPSSFKYAPVLVKPRSIRLSFTFQPAPEAGAESSFDRLRAIAALVGDSA